MSDRHTPTVPQASWFLQVVCTPLRPQEAVAIGLEGLLARWIQRDAGPQVVQTAHANLGRLAAITAAADGFSFAIAGNSDVVEVRAWDDLRLLRSFTLPRSDDGDRVDVWALALSPDGRWLAVADSDNRVYLVDYLSGRPGPPVDGGEWTGALAFAPSSRLLASACSYQGGADVRVDRVLDEGVAAGSLIPLYEEWRSELGTLAEEFVDALSDVAFSPSGRQLALFETSRIPYGRPAGWRGDVVLYTVESGTLHWCASIDAAVTGDTRSLEEAGHGMGFYSGVLFVDDEHLLCGATAGLVLAYRTDTGTVADRIQLPTEADVHVLAQDGGGVIWAVLGNGEVMTLARESVLKRLC